MNSTKGKLIVLLGIIMWTVAVIFAAGTLPRTESAPARCGDIVTVFEKGKYHLAESGVWQAVDAEVLTVTLTSDGEPLRVWGELMYQHQYIGNTDIHLDFMVDGVRYGSTISDMQAGITFETLGGGVYHHLQFGPVKINAPAGEHVLTLLWKGHETTHAFGTVTFGAECMP